MKLLPIAAFTILVSTSAAMAGAGAPVPEGSQNPPPSGRPSAPLDDAACQDMWKMASPNGDTLSKDKGCELRNGRHRQRRQNIRG